MLWALAQRIAEEHPAAMRRAGHRNADSLFDAMPAGRSAITFTEDEYTDTRGYVFRPGHRVPLPLPELLGLLADPDSTPAVRTTEDFPVVPAAGRCRALTANTVFRDDTWRKRDPQGALRVSPHGAERSGLSDGAPARIATARGTARAAVEIDDRPQPGHAALPDGFGLALPTEDGRTERTGVALLSSAVSRQPSAVSQGPRASAPATRRAARSGGRW
ncbi:molybdopterin dinucleotide binding domain-containing protein [Streptomyces roseolus]|uniref:molybdopterin dinucleotide binding domain-containing protein n=1 Tax=Streptomyces roseolus TaxID=67358 RepID=UPI0019C36827|nr:molybdopterin dinucleotide binding domain-containing protein [Streptomyces roseolus]GGR54061.1 hypothetical protein GCM10010282_53990 [Streptomyces roseolus]